MSARVPIGQKLHNPLNIRRTSITWAGKSAVQQHEAFETFDSPYYGIRAAARNLLTYYRRDKLNTVQGIVTKWAPPEDDNATGADEPQGGGEQVGLQRGEFSDVGLALAPPGLRATPEGAETGAGGVDEHTVITGFQAGVTAVGDVDGHRQAAGGLLDELGSVR